MRHKLMHPNIHVARFISPGTAWAYRWLAAHNTYTGKKIIHEVLSKKDTNIRYVQEEYFILHLRCCYVRYADPTSNGNANEEPVSTAEG